MHFQRSLMFGVTCCALAVSLAACGSTGATSTSTKSSSSKSSSSASSSSSPANSSSPADSGGAGLSLSKLASYTNYAFTYSATGGGATTTFTGAVHSLTDWRLQASSPAVTNYDVDGKGYGTVAGFSAVTSTTFATPEGIHHLNGQYVNAQALIGMTHVTGEDIRKGGSCTVAGQDGTIYNLGTPKNSYFSIGDQACVASNGALLLFAQGVTGGASADALHLTGASEIWQVTAVGGVGPIAAP
ncbi:hypothetical protein [Ferrimicrobium sp.]|uniref:hypothetical protein n=1 Tax=Ferrimicrobium sp. TaxID=2926050 RepID=UPI0026239789|nr:hypothetical protein [Ferrimicrobium sp.]